ncbi:Aste57867_23196 [Aphanomyces stellatus]|uniref:beta-glucosidase n=1 Tax=Aphanomyces stellatus TaxID=120398 RepID=A0A485LM45_9STRA|nr:hypothetical protein As57867_023125 [Aphanomyces stellatus]VFT99843.1 Aste57867_23196 [Aphanomyces stellatus]
MGTYIGVNGVPLAASAKLHQGLRRHDLKFQGMMVTDWGEVYLLNSHYHVVTSDQDATHLSLSESTYDVCMVPYDTTFADYSKTLVAQNKVLLFQESVQRILKLELDLGLFETPVPGADVANDVGDAASEAAALAIARESIVLLKNTNNMLPLKSSASVFLTGPAADDIGMLCGGWTYYWQGIAGGHDLIPHGQTIKQAMRGSTDIYQGVDMDVAGYQPRQTTGEPTRVHGNDDQPALPSGLITYVQALATTNTKLILVLAFGRPRLLNGIADLAVAVLWAGLPCEMGGQAFSDVLFGAVNPSGKLAAIHLPQGRRLLQLGHAILLSNPRSLHQVGGECLVPCRMALWRGVELHVVCANQKLTISVTITNTGTMAGQEVVMLFVTPPPSATRAIVDTKLLKKFTKIQLNPSQAKTVVRFGRGRLGLPHGKHWPWAQQGG